MKHTIQKFKIETELDVVLAYRSAMQLSEVCGLKMAAQTKFSTAVSEICRNVIEHVGLGTIELGLHEEKGQFCLEANIADNGRGIVGLDEFMNRKFATNQLKGNGIFNSRRLADEFRIESAENVGTEVWLRKRLPANHPPINKAIISGWKEHFSKEVVISPYAELKRQNQQLIDLLDQLRLRNLEVEHQIDEIQRLNQELENANSEVTDLLTQREESNVRLLQANRELDAFAYTVSHDLKAPLRNIEGLSSAIFESLKINDHDDALHCTRLIIEQAKRMDGLIGGILDSARTGLLKLEKKNLSLTSFIKNLTSNFTVPNGFLVQVQPNMPQIQTEELLLAQVLMNLLTNAIKHHDKPEGKVTVSCENKEDKLLFTVQDDGPGIAAEHQNLIFHPFGSIATGKAVDSTGLGLSIVKRIVESKGGKIWVESEGRGAKFSFTWPAEEVAAETADSINQQHL